MLLRNVGLLSFLLDEYTELATAITSIEHSMLITSFKNPSKATTAYTFERYRELNRQFNEINGYLPLHYYLETQNPDLNIVTLMCSIYPEVVEAPTRNGRNLPLHLLLGAHFNQNPHRADIFRLFLKLHPASSCRPINQSTGTASIELSTKEDGPLYFIRNCNIWSK